MAKVDQIFALYNSNAICFKTHPQRVWCSPSSSHHSSSPNDLHSLLYRWVHDKKR